MTKSIIINYSEADESLLMAFFKRLKITIKVFEPTEATVIKQRLHDKYAIDGSWETMGDDEKVDAAHAETMIYAQEQPDYHVFSVAESKEYRAQLRQKLTQYAEH
jgi:hypothetical protein